MGVQNLISNVLRHSQIILSIFVKEIKIIFTLIQIYLWLKMPAPNPP